MSFLSLHCPLLCRKQGLWLNAISATVAISIAPFVILFFLNVDNSEEKRGWLKVLLGYDNNYHAFCLLSIEIVFVTRFASGGLLGDAFLHLIPHAMMAQEGGHGHSHSHSHGHSHGGGGEEEPHVHDLSVGLGVLAGILAFLTVEKLVHIYKSGSGGHGHSHGLPPPPAKDKKKSDEGAKGDAKKKKKKDKDSDKEDDDDNKSSPKKDSEKKEEKDSKMDEDDASDGGDIHVAGYLNLAADFFHNFTDGLAIGASFLAGNSVGFATTVMIFCHEIPHEIGDYAILIQSGHSPFRAKCLQLLTAVGALLGCIVSISFGELGDAVTARVLPFTAGGFIYIATVSVIPELLEGTTLKQSLWEIAFLILGVAMMVVIGMYE